MDIHTLQTHYTAATLTPAQVVTGIYDRIAQAGERPVWITLVPRAQALARAEALTTQDRAKLSLYGIPFAVKDNLDVAGLPTTAGCPAFAHDPEETATVVTRLEAAGAILIGKTNMDQFATGLVGTRSPYGTPTSVFDPASIAGGSSSGSAVAVAQGLVSFALGTDTAGSGRVPAMFNNLVGLKPTRGLVSTHGVVPACRTLDCVSIFTTTVADAATVLTAAAAYDPKDPYSRTATPGQGATPWSACAQGSAAPRIGVLRPNSEDRHFFGDTENEALYDRALAQLRTLGATTIEVDFQPLLAAAKLLYGGPWVAERYAALAGFIEEHEAAMDPTVAQIITGARRFTAVDAFAGQYELARLRRYADELWQQLDLLCLPTAPRSYTLAAMIESPAEQRIERNAHLGTYTNFVNLLDMCAIAVPAGLRSDGKPFGVSLLGPAFADEGLLPLADQLHRALNTKLGGTSEPLETTPKLMLQAAPHGSQLMTVVGAHLTGQPLNWQLTQRKGRLLRRCRTAASYRLYALANTTPPKPGLVYEPGFPGPGIEVEVWALPTDTVGSFLEGIPAPLGLGTLTLEDGSQTKGFLVEPAGLQDAVEITHLGGWRAYLGTLRKP